LLRTSQPVDAPPAPARAAGLSGASKPRFAWLGATARRRLVTYVPPLLVALVALPFLLHQNAWWEWQNPYWLLERQTAHVAEHGTPTLFLHTSVGKFYPHYVFYGGPLFALAAYPATIVGAWPVFVATIVAALLAGYVGIYWTARNLGLARGLAVLPALIFATMPWMVTEVYGRSAWTELVAINAAALMLGAATSLFWRPGHARRRSLAALTLGMAAVGGSHTLTTMTAGVGLPLFLLLLAPVLPRPLEARRLLRTAGSALAAIALGVGLTAAWLLPNLWFGSDTAATTKEWSAFLLDFSKPMLDPSIVLSPVPAVNDELRDINYFFNQPSVLAIGWALLAVAVVVTLRRGRPSRELASIAGLVVVGAALLAVIVTPSWWPHFPAVIQAIQFPFRLVPFVAIACALVMMLALRQLPRGLVRGVLVGGLVLVTAAQVGIGLRQAQTTEARTSTSGVEPGPRSEITAESEIIAFGGSNANAVQFRVIHRPTGPAERGRSVPVQLTDVTTSDVGILRGRDRVGAVRMPEVIWSPFVRIEGDVEVVGRVDAGYAKVRVVKTDADGAWSATVRPVCSGLCLTSDAPWPLVVGRLLSFFSVLAVLGIGGRWLWGGWRARGATRG
jgi:hypothetical protein